MAIVDNFAGSEDTQDIAERATAMAAAAALDGSHERALSHARVSLAQAGAVNLRHDAIRWVWPIAADAALALEDDAEVLRLLDWLDDHPPGHIPPVLRAERLRVRARLHERRGEAEAGPAFATATKAFRDLGSPFHLSTALLDHAQHVSSHGDLETAAELAAEAGVIAERLLVTPLMQRVEQLGRQRQLFTEQSNIVPHLAALPISFVPFGSDRVLCDVVWAGGDDRDLFPSAIDVAALDAEQSQILRSWFTAPVASSPDRATEQAREVMQLHLL